MNEPIIIIGAGYVGLPLAIAFSKKYPVICYDINKQRIKELIDGYDINQQHLKKDIKKKKLIFTYDINLLKNFFFYIITVPTPINKFNQPDLKSLKKASILVGKSIKKKSIVIYESTTYPGCTEEFCIPLLEQYSKLKYNRDFFVAYSPERVNPGDKINTLKSITKIVGADNPKILRRVKYFYMNVCKSVFSVNSIKVAEAAKVIENIQRDVNIALVNELSILFHELNISTNEALKAAATKWNFHYYKPGLVGGHCISVDPYYLAYKAKRCNYFPKLLLAGRTINEKMSKYVVKQTIKILSTYKINIKKTKIALLGLSFKENIPDIRNTKVFGIIKEFKRKNISVHVFDTIASKKQAKENYNIKLLSFKDLNKNKYDVIILAVSHKEFLKKINFYNKFYRNKKKKIFIDIKNNYSEGDLKKNNFIHFQL
jgi:UDP-N-acetyl-D-galactosamine dehydrogenase